MIVQHDGEKSTAKAKKTRLDRLRIWIGETTDSDAYLPTPEEIAEETAKIRSNWSEAKHAYRRRVSPHELTLQNYEERTCKCGNTFRGTSRRRRCDECQREHERRYYRDYSRKKRAAEKRKGVAR